LAEIEHKKQLLIVDSRLSIEKPNPSPVAMCRDNQQSKIINQQ